MEEMELILDEGAGYLIEFKESVSDSLAKEMVAFANSSGGWIFLGVSDDGRIKRILPEEFGLTSISRNPFLQGLFHRANLVERIGSGIGRMRDEMKTAGLPEPEFNWDGFFRITFLKGGVEHGGAADELVKEEKVTKSLTMLQIQILKNSEKPVSMLELAEIAGVYHRSFFKKQHLDPLIQDGLIAMTIPDKPRSSKQKYVITAAGKELIASVLKGNE